MPADLNRPLFTSRSVRIYRIRTPEMLRHQQGEFQRARYSLRPNGDYLDPHGEGGNFDVRLLPGGAGVDISDAAAVKAVISAAIDADFFDVPPWSGLPEVPGVGGPHQSFDSLAASLRGLPMTLYGAILELVVEEAYKAGTFVPGGASRVASFVEAGIGQEARAEPKLTREETHAIAAACDGQVQDRRVELPWRDVVDDLLHGGRTDMGIDVLLGRLNNLATPIELVDMSVKVDCVRRDPSLGVVLLFTVDGEVNDRAEEEPAA